jgi:hypothetical protein
MNRETSSLPGVVLFASDFPDEPEKWLDGLVRERITGDARV